MNSNRLTSRQRKFAEVYAGDGVKAARAAGYSGDEGTLAVRASELVRMSKVRAIILSREIREVRPHVLNRLERQQFWTEVIRDSAQPMSDRLRASELLGRSEADFTDNLNNRVAPLGEASQLSDKQLADALLAGGKHRR